MKHVIDNQFVLSRAPEGPLAAWLDGFARFSSAKGYAVGTIQRRLLSAANFSGWLQKERIELSDLTSDHPALYLRHRARHARPHLGAAEELKQLVEFLRLEGVVPAEPEPASRTTPVERCVQAFEQYLQEVRGLVDLTIQSRAPVVRRLPSTGGNGGVTGPTPPPLSPDIRRAEPGR